MQIRLRKLSARKIVSGGNVQAAMKLESQIHVVLERFASKHTFSHCTHWRALLCETLRLTFDLGQYLQYVQYLVLCIGVGAHYARVSLSSSM